MRPVQLTFATVGRHPALPEESQRRAALHAIGRVAPGLVVLFALVDDHIHLVLYCKEDVVGRLARALLLALRRITAVEIAPAHVSEVRDRDHLEWLVGYMLGQSDHHGVRAHPALSSGSCFSELVFARSVPGLATCLTAALPRYLVRDAYTLVGLPQVELKPASSAQIRAAGAWRLVDAAAYAAAAGPELGRDEPSVRARRVVVQLADEAGIHPYEVADAIGITRDAARKIGLRPAPPQLLTATRRRIALEAAAAVAGAAAAAAALLPVTSRPKRKPTRARPASTGAQG